MSFYYSLSNDDLNAVRLKIDKQRYYLENETFVTPNGEVKSLLDVSFSANHSERYFSRILNKVNTFVSYNLSRDYVPVFMTVTLDGYFRDFLKGDFGRMKLDDYKSIPNNERYGYLLDKIASKVSFDIKDLYNVLAHQFHRFLRSYNLQSIRKAGFDYSYIRVTEPHKDGVPHFHILLFCREQDLQKIKYEFEKFFPAPQNHKKIDDYQTNGFQTEIRSASGYILKYILKTFRNVIENADPDYLDAWYIHYRIPRLITSHTLVGQDLYTKIAILDDDWYYLSTIDIFRDTLRDFTIFTDDNRKIIVNYKHVQIYNCGKLVREYGSAPAIRKDIFVFNKKTIFSIQKPIDFSILKLFDIRFSKLLKVKKQKYEIEFVYLDNFKHKSIKKLSLQSLFEHYINFDFDKYEPARFGMLKKELIERGVLPYEQIILNDYNSDFVVKDDWLREPDLN